MCFCVLTRLQHAPELQHRVVAVCQIVRHAHTTCTWFYCIYSRVELHFSYFRHGIFDEATRDTSSPPPSPPPTLTHKIQIDTRKTRKTSVAARTFSLSIWRNGSSEHEIWRKIVATLPVRCSFQSKGTLIWRNSRASVAAERRWMKIQIYCAHPRTINLKWTNDSALCHICFILNFLLLYLFFLFFSCADDRTFLSSV